MASTSYYFIFSVNSVDGSIYTKIEMINDFTISKGIGLIDDALHVYLQIQSQISLDVIDIS
jgi:hypothetical protein